METKREKAGKERDKIRLAKLSVDNESMGLRTLFSLPYEKDFLKL